MNEWISLVVLGGIVAIALVVVGIVLYRKKHPKGAKPTGKKDGAQRAVQAAKRFARTHGFSVIAPAKLTRGEKVAQLDAIVVGYFGILGVKALGYNGSIYGNPTDDEWLQIAGDGTRTYFANPVKEASADMRVVRDALFAKKLKTTPVEVVCVFTSPQAQLALPRNAGHFTMKTFKQLLGKEKYQADGGLELQKVEEAVRAAMKE